MKQGAARPGDIHIRSSSTEVPELAPKLAPKLAANDKAR